jgi:hypothetical protein
VQQVSVVTTENSEEFCLQQEKGVKVFEQEVAIQSVIDRAENSRKFVSTFNSQRRPSLSLHILKPSHPLQLAMWRVILEFTSLITISAALPSNTSFFIMKIISF